ncbi:PAS domain S-box protein [Paenibacillus frigoriresistens]|uniref:PAS domain S-box protein n=1 Tax=Paenibacillus alginolyticus TaxID=59839 RepID=UPI0015630A85|nr:EAL domain-containing protein [Paenibacillus frigoriresistens]NRF96067.1 PAS domain S-box protein [Paenibacillus frigoriresistens]
MNNFQFNNEKTDALSSINIINGLKDALKRNELTVVYQPQIDIRTGRVIGNEVLVRWTHPKFGSVSPGLFITFAEKSGLIVPIGEWVLKTACAQNKTWQDSGLEPMTISVNISPRQFAQRNFEEVVRMVLEESGLAPQYLDLEITEGMVMDINSALPTLHRLKELGVRISMDDFGKGYSSLYYLKRLPLDKLKIDQSFIRDCTTDESDATIVKTIISMAHHLKLNVIAEGVETREQLIFLQQNLCDEVQGYLFCKPLPAEELVQKLSDIKIMVRQYGMDTELSERMWLEEQLRAARQNLVDTVRKQQGMTFKFREQCGQFIHALCDGELLYRMGFSPEQVVGKGLHEFLPPELADTILQFYQKAWQGQPHVTYEGVINGIWYFTSLRPIRRGGKVVEVIGSCVDITVRKLMEQELKATKDHLESFIQNTSDAIYIMDPNKLVSRVNQAFVNMFGWTDEDILGKQPPIIPEHMMNEIDSLIERMFSGEVITGYETLRQSKDGSIVNVSVSMSPIKDTSGKAIAIAGVLRDISDKKKAEAALKESVERYRQLIEMSPDIILVHNQGEVLFINQAGLDFADIKNPDTCFSSRSIYSLLAPEQREESAGRVRKLMDGEKLPPIERKIIHKNSEFHYFEVTSALIEFQGKKAIQIIARDITERKHKEESLSRINEQYQLIAENMLDLLAVLDVNGAVKYVSPSHEQVMGFPPQYFEKQSIFSLVHPKDIDTVQNKFTEMIETKSPRQVEFRYKHKNGNWVYLEAKGTPILSKNGELENIITVSRDVTERKMVEEKLRNSGALAAVGELAAGVAHEIRNPITSIKGFVQLMKDKKFKLEYFDVMFSEFKTLESKIDEFLLLAKPQVVQYMPLRLWELLQDVLLLLESQAILNNVHVFSEPINEDLTIMGDRQQLKQVFVNLLKNAIEAMPGGGEILIQMKKSESDNVSVSIRDQGCGISEERLKRIGEPFFSSKEKGNGLGLTISHKIVREHDGIIRFDSELNKGTTVQVSFPIQK